VTRAPFSVQEEGWGEFDLVITVHFHHSSETFRIIHDLNFHEGESYFKHYKFNMPGASPEFLALFNQRPGAARKTLPPAGAKAQKAPPRDAGRSKPHSSPYSNDYSDSLSSYSDNSDSDDSSAKRSNHSTAAIPSARMQQLQGQSDRRQSAAGRSSTTVEKPITPVNRADRSAAAGVAGVKRRLADSMVFSASTSIPLRQTLAPAEMLKASVSPTLGPDAHTDATMSYTNMSLAAGIAGVKVPKKRDRVIKTENESDQPSSKIARTEPEPAHALKRPDGDIPSINSVNREMKRVLEKAREKSSQSAAAKQEPHTVASGVSSSVGIGGLVRDARGERSARNGDNNSTTGTGVALKDEYLDAELVSSDELSDQAPDSVTSREKIKREVSNVSSVSASKQTKPSLPRSSASTGTASSRSPPGNNRSRERQPPKTSLMRTIKRPGSAEKKNGVRPGASAAPTANKPSTYTESAKSAQPSNLTLQMKRIMEIAESMKERELVAFLKLLHTLRIEQDPDEADAMTKNAANKVMDTGEYSCNLSALHPEAIGRLWDFVSEIAV
ncbi:hypothetical protein LPJ73_004475, partial [Coemansia sp. RSA 2703]